MTGKAFKQVLLDSVKALFKGEFLLRIGADKYFIHIMYAFLLALTMIWLSLRIDKTLSVVERNKVILKDLTIQYAEKQGERAKLDRISAVELQLRNLGSDLCVPGQPATVIKKKN